MLADLQAHLSEIYQADCGHSLTDFLITDRARASSLGRKPLADGVEETVLLADCDDGLALCVFIDAALLGRLAGQNPLQQLQRAQISDLTTVLEGISHFNYVTWCAARDRNVSLLELELQAEVDKYVATLLLALEQNQPELARGLHGWIFDDVSYHRSLQRDERERYETANDYAARFCRRIHRRVGENATLEELRSFYRMSQPEKFSYIHASAWSKDAGGLSGA